MVTIGRHVSKLSGYAPALPTLFGTPTIVAPHGPDNPHPQRRRASGGGSDCSAHVAGQTKLPPRPSPEILSEAIPLFFIGRNEDGFWVARESDGRIGGIFLRKRSALRFANRSAQPGGCAIMFLSERFELDVENKGNPFVAHLARCKAGRVATCAAYGGMRRRDGETRPSGCSPARTLRHRFHRDDRPAACSLARRPRRQVGFLRQRQ